MFNQSITDGHLENDKMAETPYSNDQSIPNKGFSMPKWYICTFYLNWRPSFQNPRWPPSAILDMFQYSKITKSASKLPHKLILTIFGALWSHDMSLQRGLCSINQSHAAILKTTKSPKYHTRVINPVPTKVLACQNDTYVRIIWVGCHISEIQDGRRQPYWICSDIQKSPNLHRNDHTISFWPFLDPSDRLPCRCKGGYVQSINHRRPSWKWQNDRTTILKWSILSQRRF